MTVWLAVFRAAAAMLPARFRAEYLAEAERDLADTLATRRRERGRLAAAAAGAAALADLARRVPVEWWAALRGHDKGRGSVHGSGTKEWIIMTWTNDLRIATRALLRRPGFTAAATLTLALGIGATVAIFTVVNAILLRPLPYPDADRVVSISHHAPGLNLPDLSISQGMVNFYRAEADFFGSLGAFGGVQRNLVGGAEPERVQLTSVTPSVFTVLQARPAIGRPFTEEDAKEGAPPVTILTDATWKTRFGADPSVLGRTIELDGTATEIVGVMPEGLAFPNERTVALLPMAIDPNGSFGSFGIEGIARLAPGVTLDQAQRRASELQSRLSDFFPDLSAGFLDQTGWSVTVERYQDRVVGEDVARGLWVVLATVTFVLLIACANVANLFLVRAESRQKELAVRTAMGAGAGRIAAGFLSEATLLGAVGGVLGLLFAWAGVATLVAHGPRDLPRLYEVSVDAQSLGFAVLVSFAVSLLLGTFPLVRHRAIAIAHILRDGGRGSTVGRERHRMRGWLVTSQLGLALVLLVASGLMLRSFDRLRRVDTGFDASDVVTVGMSLGQDRSKDHQEGAAFYQRVADEVAALPGVTSVGLTSRAPMGEGDANGGSFYIEGKQRQEGELPPVAMYKLAGAGYFDAMRQPLLSGRALDRSDWEGGPAVTVVNKTFEDTYLDGSAIGKAIKWDEGVEYARVVGVVGDVHEFGLRDDVKPTAYLPMVVGKWGYPGLDRMFLVVRGDGRGAVPVAAIRDIVHRLGPSVPITSVRTMQEVMARSMAQTSFTMVLLGIAAGVALFLGAIGLFGVISYIVSQRTREIGVRIALGAARADIQTLVFRQGARAAVAGVVIGLGGALALTRLMRTVLFGVEARDPITFVGAPVVLLCVAALATWLPARRAARVDPVEALGAE